MIIYLIQLLFPNYYRRVWNAEFTKQMERFRMELYSQHPEHTDIVDKAITKALEDNLKK